MPEDGGRSKTAVAEQLEKQTAPLTEEAEAIEEGSGHEGGEGR